MKTIYLARGISGSGKSTLLKELSNQLFREKHILGIVSADDYWMRPDGVYDFNWRLLSNAHNLCKNRYIHALRNYQFIAVDNTNTTWKEVEYYIVEGNKAGFNIVLLEPATTWKMDADSLFGYNVHNVPLESIKKMIARWESSQDIIAKAINEFNVSSDKISIQIGI